MAQEAGTVELIEAKFRGMMGSLERSSKLVDFWYVLFGFSAAGLFAFLTLSYTTDAPIKSDAAWNARAAYHLVHTGVMGADEANPRPQLHREPIPILVIAALLLVHRISTSPTQLQNSQAGLLPKPLRTSM